MITKGKLTSNDIMKVLVNLWADQHNQHIEYDIVNTKTGEVEHAETNN